MKMKQLWKSILFRKARHTLYNALKYSIEKQYQVEHLIAINWIIDNPNLQSMPNIKHLVVKNEFFPESQSVKFPSKLVKLCIDFKSPDEMEFPTTLKELSIGWTFNQPIKPGFFPIGLKVLEFGTNFNQPITELSNLTNLTDLKLGWNFNQSIDNLPNSLRCLTLMVYRRPLTKLPIYLEELYIGSELHHSISIGVLPFTLQKLTCYRYDHVLETGVLPKNIKYVKLIGCCDFGVNALPKNLKHLELPNVFFKNREYKLPCNLECLHIGHISVFSVLPSSLIELHVHTLSNCKLLRSLVKLKKLHILMNTHVNINLDEIPDSLTEITMQGKLYFVVKRKWNPFSFLSKNKLIHAQTHE
jgi:hypothetical protein